MATDIPIIEPRMRTGVVLIGEDGQALLTTDATLSENHARSARITQYPREDDSPVSNHIQPEQRTLGLEIVVSKTQLFGEGGVNRDRDAYELLESLQTNQRVVTIVTSLRTYTGMALSSLGAVRTAAIGQQLVADTSWQQIEVVNTSLVDIPPDIIEAAFRSSGKAKDNAKDQVRNDSSDQRTQSARKKTMAKGLIDAGATVFGG